MVQMPTWPGEEQVAQGWLHALPQHTPPTQKPDLHWAGRAQQAPLSCTGTQVPPQLHTRPLAQSASLLHEAGQPAAAPSHT